MSKSTKCRMQELGWSLLFDSVYGSDAAALLAANLTPVVGVLAPFVAFSFLLKKTKHAFFKKHFLSSFTVFVNLLF